MRDWDSVVTFFQGLHLPHWFVIVPGKFLVAWIFAFHSFNGLRHLVSNVSMSTRYSICTLILSLLTELGFWTRIFETDYEGFGVDCGCYIWIGSCLSGVILAVLMSFTLLVVALYAWRI